MLSHPRIIVVGGGPIGLAHAAGIKLLNKNIDVTVIEKYPEYQRKHTLIMEPDNLNELMNITEAHENEKLKTLLKKLKKDKHIRTNELEQTLKKLALENKVEIINENVDEERIEQLLNEEKPALIIGADGTHSTINRSLFRKAFLLKLDPGQTIAEAIKDIKSTDESIFIYVTDELSKTLRFITLEKGVIKESKDLVTIKPDLLKASLHSLDEKQDLNTLEFDNVTAPIYVHKPSRKTVDLVTVEENKIKGVQKTTISRDLLHSILENQSTNDLSPLIRELNPKNQSLVTLSPTQVKALSDLTSHPVPNNHVKKQFDFVLQLRYEIQGEHKSKKISNAAFIQNMAREGLIANEYVGNYDEKTKTTPVTMQMMISKEDYEGLKEATSKDPIKPFMDEKNSGKPKIPRNLSKFVFSYLTHRVKASNISDELILKNSVTISVNEAPATHAKNIFTLTQHETPVVLVGDAGLGLSYFKGLNAGLLSTAKLLEFLKTSIQNNFTGGISESLKNYQQWFKDFSAKKVKEVESYSFWNIRSFMKGMRLVYHVKGSSHLDDLVNERDAILDYLNVAERAHYESNILNRGKPSLYPHRKHGLVKFAQFDLIPIAHHLEKVAKLFSNTFKPYKSAYHFKEELKQPLSGVAYLLTGVGKFLWGILGLNPNYLLDGTACMLRGAIEIATTPFTWLIKAPLRKIITAIVGEPTIETNKGIKRLVKIGNQKLVAEPAENKSKPLSEKTRHEFLAICNDLHRKFEKSFEDRKQSTTIDPNLEFELYTKIRMERDTIDRLHFHRYISLFKGVAPNATIPTSVEASILLPLEKK